MTLIEGLNYNLCPNCEGEMQPVMGTLKRCSNCGMELYREDLEREWQRMAGDAGFKVILSGPDKGKLYKFTTFNWEANINPTPRPTY